MTYCDLACDPLRVFDGTCECHLDQYKQLQGDDVNRTIERGAAEPRTADEKTLTVSQYPKGKTEPADLPFADPKCGARWSGHNTAHCISCHRTFAGVQPFDKHRKSGECVDPASVGLAINPNRKGTVWGSR